MDHLAPLVRKQELSVKKDSKEIGYIYCFWFTCNPPPICALCITAQLYHVIRNVSSSTRIYEKRQYLALYTYTPGSVWGGTLLLSNPVNNAACDWRFMFIECNSYLSESTTTSGLDSSLVSAQHQYTHDTSLNIRAVLSI